jgi:hypothetical protein
MKRAFIFSTDLLTKNIFLLTIFLSIHVKGQNLFPGGADPFDKYNEYAVSTIGLSTINSAFTTFNIVRTVNIDQNKSNATFGLLFGAAQIAYGVFNINSNNRNNQAYKTVNISVGLTTVLTSGFRLLGKNSKLQKKKMNFE